VADRSITIRLGANVTSLVSGFKTAQQSVKDFGSQTQKFVDNNRQSLEQVGQAGMVAGGVLAAGFGLAVTKFASFDKAMSSVQAATHETEGNMELLREAAIRTGADTAFSAEEAARGIEEMAKAGVATEDILSGGLDGALALAAAGALDVGEAAELASTAMTQFGLAGEDIPHIADLLAAGAGKAQGSVQDMGAALKQAGLVADQTGLTIEETTGGLAAFASAGLVGSDAGTSFKSMLQRLNPQSKEAADKMAELGLSAYDSQGNFIGLSEYAGELQSALGDMTVEQRNATMSTLFGSDAVRAASVLYEQGAEGVQKWEDAVNDAGYAAETAAMMQDNLAGDLEKLGGAFDTVFLQAGSGANDALRGLVQSGEDLIDAIGKIPGPVLSAVGVVAGLTGGALLLGGAFITAVPRIADTVTAIGDLRRNAPRATSALDKMGKAAGIAAAAFVGFEVIKGLHNGMQPATLAVEDMTQALIGMKKGGEGLDEIFASIDFGEGSNLAGEIDGIGEAAERLASSSLGDSVQRFGADILGIDNGMAKLRGTFEAADDAMAELATSGNLETAAAGFRDAADGLGSVDKAAEMFPEYINSLKTAASDAGVFVEQQDLLNWAMGEVPAVMEAAAVSTDGASVAIAAEAGHAQEAAQITEAMADALIEMGIAADGTITNLAAFSEVLLNTGLVQLSANGAARGFEAAIDDVSAKITGIIETYGSLNGILNENANGFNRDTAAGREAEAAFDAVASSGAGLTQALAENGATQEELQGSLRGTYDSLIVAAGQFGITGGEADFLARQVMGIPDEANIDTWMSDAARQKAEETIGTVNRLDGMVATVTTIMKEITEKQVIDLGTSKAGTPVRAGQVGFKATGGAIYGPGSGTSDTAGLYALSNGEHVLTAKEVKAMGGQAAVYDFRSRLTAGVPGYASGGEVGARQVAGRQYIAPIGVGSGGGVVNNYNIDAAPGVAYKYAQEVAVHAVQRSRDAQSAYGI
jgi:TP901 family phage tail tape measure protein